MYVCMCVGVCIFLCVCDFSSVSWYVFVSMIRCLYLCGSMSFLCPCMCQFLRVQCHSIKIEF